MRRFLLISGLFLLLLVLLDQADNLHILSLQGNLFAEHTAYAATRTHSAFAAPQSDPLCPAASQDSAKKEASLTFCSPTYQGVAGGPFGVQITLIGQNFPGKPTEWLISQEPLKNKQLATCGSASDIPCSILSNPTQQTLSTQAQSSTSLFSWTWAAKRNFPTTVGAYYITAVFTSAQNQLSTVSTPDTFQLLTANAPCIVLNKETCVTSQTQALTIDPSKVLKVHGENWLFTLSQGADTTETIFLTASCIKKQACSQATVTTTVLSSQIGATGTFNYLWSLPTSLQGTYHISATNSVPSTSNSVILPLDSNGPDIKVAPRSPVSTPINIIPFNIMAFLAMLPALAGIFAFLFLWGTKKIFAPKIQSAPNIPSRLAFIRQPATTQIPNSFNQQSVQSQQSVRSSQPPASLNTPVAYLGHEQIIAPFPFQITPIRTPYKTNHNLEGELQNAIAECKKYKDPKYAIAKGCDVLTTDIAYWETLIGGLKKALSGSPALLDKWEQRGIMATGALFNETNLIHRQRYCSEALLYYTLCLSFRKSAQTSTRSEDAPIYFDMGFAAFCLALSGAQTLNTLLTQSRRDYGEAARIYEQQAQWHLLAKTEVALGDVSLAQSSASSSSHAKFVEHQGKALASYRSALIRYGQHGMQDYDLENAIRLRINYLERKR
jgi:hypothetical protein